MKSLLRENDNSVVVQMKEMRETCQRIPPQDTCLSFPYTKIRFLERVFSSDQGFNLTIFTSLSLLYFLCLVCDLFHLINYFCDFAAELSHDDHHHEERRRGMRESLLVSYESEAVRKTFERLNRTTLTAPVKVAPLFT
jgi:hypothetical protein